MMPMTEEQTMLSDMLARYFTDANGSYQWAELAELGVLGALFAESHGGYGGSAVDLGVVFEQTGRAACQLPLIDSALLPGLLLAAANQPLSALISGESRYAVAHTELASRYDTDVISTSVTNGTITGEKTLVFSAGDAQHLLISAVHEQQVGLYRVAADAPGIRLNTYEVVQGGYASDLLLSSVPAELLMNNALDAIQHAWAAALVAQAADTVGALEKVVSMTKEYLVTRQQFGRALRDFQVLSHRFTDMLIALEQVRSALSLAIAHLDDEPASRDLHGSACKNLIGRMGRAIAEDSVQMNGGIGMTAEYQLGHYLKRIIMADHRFGDTDYHMERFIELSRHTTTGRAE
ncbi:MAG: acyl-CoA dehydrogenase family protein [Pseudomonadota bacterium]